jgi:hypothetical protein
MLAIIHTRIEKIHDVDTKMKMRLSQTELLGSAAVLVYIVFFALHPPLAIRDALSSPVGLAVAFGGSLLVMLYQSKIVGGLLILALLLTMTKVTEHLTTQETSELAAANATITQLQAAGLNPETNDALKNALATKARLSATTTTPPATTTTPPATTPPAASRQEAAGSPPIPQSTGSAAANPPSSAPPASTGTPKPVMACNIENFASF